VQQAARAGRITVKKVRGEENLADLFTKHLSSREKVTQLVGLLGCRYEEGRPAAAPAMRRERMTQTTLGQAMNQSCQEAFGEHDEDVAYVMTTVGEAESCRTGLLPHQHDPDEIETLFPTMVPISPEDLKIGEDYVHPTQRADVEEMGDTIAADIAERSRREGRRKRMFDTSC
jgi:hypothetical protein